MQARLKPLQQRSMQWLQPLQHVDKHQTPREPSAVSQAGSASGSAVVRRQQQVQQLLRPWWLLLLLQDVAGLTPDAVQQRGQALGRRALKTCAAARNDGRQPAQQQLQPRRRRRRLRSCCSSCRRRTHATASSSSSSTSCMARNIKPNGGTRGLEGLN